MKLQVFLIWGLMSLQSAHCKTSNLSSERIKTRWPKNENVLNSDGSGLGEEDGDDGYNDYEGSSEGSGELPNKKITINEKSSCLKLLETASFHKMVGAFVPRCSFDGAFEPLQCHGVTGECWCSDKEGRKIPGTIRKEPDMPKCDNTVKGRANEGSKKSRPSHKSHTRTTKMNKIFFEVQTNSEPPRRSTAGTSKENIVVDNIAINENSEVLVPYKTLNNAGGETRKYSRKYKESSGVMPYYDRDGESYGKYQMSASRAALMMTHPGVLAGIICAGVVLVLCFVTFVTFVAYRLRRRSYYQAEEKSKTPPMAGGYIAGSGYGEIYGDGFRYSPAKYQTPTKIPPWSGIDTNGSLSYSMRHDRELYG